MDDAEIIEEVERLLPEVGKLLHAALAGHPLAAKRTIPQLRVLVFLHHRERATIGEVAAGVGASMPSISELIDRLVEDGSVERDVNPADRRQVLVRLTPRAREFGDKMHQMRRAQVRAALDRLTPEERPYLLRSVQALAEALRLEHHQLEGCGSPETPGQD